MVYITISNMLDNQTKKTTVRSRKQSHVPPHHGGILHTHQPIHHFSLWIGKIKKAEHTFQSQIQSLKI